MRARHLALLLTSLTSLALGSALHACAVIPVGLIDHDDAAPPSESGAGSDTSTADTSPPTPEDASEGSAPGTDAAPDADADADADAETADAPDG